jgi:hypothetical protein
VRTLSPPFRFIVIWFFAASNSKTIPGGSILNLSCAVASSGAKDRAARLEDLVEQDEFGLDKFSGPDPPVLVAFQSYAQHRPEQLFRRREASHQVFEAPQPCAVLRADALGKTRDQRRFRRSRRSENNYALPREQCGQWAAADFVQASRPIVWRRRFGRCRL